MQPLQSYPVFEADQVLSNGHLNNLVNYLEQQERLSRMKLLGRGIVCGLEINTSDTAISISKGCGLTSQGFLIQLCETNYTHFFSYSPLTLPNDLYFITQCGDENRNQIPYYGSNDIFELIPDTDTENEGKKPINTINLEEYVVVLFLEAEQVDLKNCDTQDCNDKGSRMDFTFRPLLVKKSLFDSEKDISFNSILLKRFNVPVADLETAEDILNGFLAITDDSTLTKLSENLIRCWDKFAVPLGLPSENPLKGLNLITVKKKLSGKTGQRIFVQYFYDFVDDLLKAYIEFRAKMRDVFGECCPDEMDFPMHLTLGLANEDTLLGKRNRQRHYFQSSPILNAQGKNTDETILLLERLVAMVKGFIGEKLQPNEPIVITPNTLGQDFISYRAIPYYYDWKAVNPLWYFSRSYSGNQRYNLGYRAALQIDATEPVKNPLLYDIERYNAFRIEGHIGKNYRTALIEIIRQKQRFNLPFDVLALNVIDLSAILNGKEIRCHIEDLESDYRVMITGIVCQLQQIMAYVGNLRPKRALEPNRNLGNLTLKKDFYISENIMDMKKTIKADISKNQPISISNADIIKNLALRDVEEGEKLADFAALDISRFIVDQKAFFEYIIRQPDLLLIFLQQLAEIVKYLLSFDLDKFDEEAYNKLWTPYSKTVANLIKEAITSENEEIKKYFSASNTEVLFKCANEKLFALKEEYLKRLEQYYAAVNFNEYFKKNSGIEHKAGVPKGGTFILVYNGKQESVLTLPELSNLSLSARNTLANLVANEAVTAKKDMQESSLKTENAKIIQEFLAASRPTEFEFASDLIKRLNLGEHAEKVLEILNIRSKEIRDQATPIAKGTVIADFYLPYLCCSDCPPVAYVIPEEKEPENIGPIANAGLDQTHAFREGANARLDGSASSDEDGIITEFSWSQQSGPPAVINTPDQAKTTVQFQSSGEYVFALKVTDDKGASAEDTVMVKVTALENNPPIAVAGPDQSIIIRNPNTPGTVSLDGSNSSDSEGGTLSFTWIFAGGAMTPTITSPDQAQTNVTGLLAGEYKFALKVTDDKGASAEDTVMVKVTAQENNPPIAVAGPDQSISLRNPNTPGTATLDGNNSSDPEGGTLSFTWIFAGGTMTPTITSPDQAQTTVTGLLVGEYKFALKVTDENGASDEDTVMVKVTTQENNPPIPVAGPDQSIIIRNPNTPGTATLDGSNSSDPEGGTLSFTWIFAGGAMTPTITNPDLAQTTVTGLLVGEYKFALKVTDENGASAEDIVTVNVTAQENNPPIAVAGPDQSISLRNPNTPGTVTLDGSNSSDPEGGTLSFTWIFAGGSMTPTITTPDQAQTTVTGLLVGEYKFALKVTDENGVSAEDIVSVNVTAQENNPPVAEAGPDQSVTLSNSNTQGTVTLDGSNSTDPDGDTLSFLWTFEGGTMTPTITSPDQVQTTVTGLLAGEYKFGLKVTDQSGNSNGDTVNVAVRSGEDVRERTCVPLSDTINTFMEFDRREPGDLFGRFLQTYPHYGQVKEFFTKLGTVVSETREKQIEFLVAEFVNTGLLSEFVKWLTGLQEIIFEIRVLRNLAFELYRILEMLAVYIVCIQKEDFADANINLEEIFKIIETHARTWASSRDRGDFDDRDWEQIQRIVQDLKEGMRQTEENGEESTKANYINSLKRIISLL